MSSVAASPVPAAVKPAAPPPASFRPKPSAWARVYHVALGGTWLAVAGFFLAWGLDYYLLPLHERAWSPDHALFKPTGLVGHRLAVAGTAMIAFGVGSYMLRKRWGRLQGLGKLRHWLSFHIFLCTLGPFLILLHTSFKVGGIVSIAFWSMVLVVSSGVVGRYVYVRIPKTLGGQFHTMQEVEAERAALLAEIEASTLPATQRALVLEEPPAPRGLLGALAFAVRSDLAGRGHARRLRAALAGAGLSAEGRERVLALDQRYRRLAQQRALLLPFGRLFRYWHTFHLPLAIVMALILLVHIGVAIAFGYGWT
jgi:hypothetical protein